MSGWRKLRREEAALVAAIVRRSPGAEQVVQSLPRQLVRDMADGGMGSLRFKAADDRDRRFGKEIGEAIFTDQDGVMASAVVNIDNKGDLFELDIWKSDFSPLQRYPQPNELRHPSFGR